MNSKFSFDCGRCAGRLGAGKTPWRRRASAFSGFIYPAALALAGCLMIAWPARAADIPFSAPQTISSLTSLQQKGMRLADMDGDGDVDVLVGSDTFSIQDCVWWENVTGRGDVWTSHPIPNSVGAWYCVPADIDRDGKMDFFTVIESGTTLPYWWRNVDGAGATWTSMPLTNVVATGSGCSFYPGDADGDGSMDFLATGQNGYFWYLNTKGDGSTWTISGTIAYNSMMNLFPVDVNGDGKLDVYGFGAPHAWWDGSNVATDSWQSHTVSAITTHLSKAFAADINGDSYPDAIAGNGSTGPPPGLYWWQNLNSGLGWAAPIEIGSRFAADAVFAADLDGDGRTDVLAGQSSTHEIIWCENINGDGSAWTTHSLPASAASILWLEAADVDCDGDLDIVGAAADGEIYWWRNQTIHRDAAFPQKMPVNFELDKATFIKAAYINHNGNMDLVVGYNDALGGQIAWLENVDGQGLTWTTHTVTTAPYDGVTAVDTADFNKDGKLDILAASKNAANELAWWENTIGSGPTWTQNSITGTYSLGCGFAQAANIDGDGFTDVVGANFLQNAVVWWRNEEITGKVWTEHVVDAAFPEPVWVVAADINHDGAMDIAAVSSLTGQLVWWQNMDRKGTSWTSHTVGAALPGANCVAAAAVTRDGKIHLVESACDLNAIVLWLNTDGAGLNFTSVTIDGNFHAPKMLCVADLDGDGDMDVAALGGAPDYFAWWENKDGGALTWIRHQEMLPATDMSSLAAADLDRDGKADLIAARYLGPDISWWPNQGGQFTLKANPSGFQNIAPGDTEPVLRIDAINNGQLGDSSLGLEQLTLRFNKSAGTPISQPELAALVESIAIYRDNGSGQFEMSNDVLILTTDTSSLLATGQLAIPLDYMDPRCQVPSHSTQSFFVVAKLMAGASAQTVNSFWIGHDPANSGSAARDTNSSLLLSLEYSAYSESLVQAVDPAIQFQSSVRSASEGSSASLFVSMNTTLASTVTVDFSTGGGTAVPGLDYQPIAGTVTFLPGQNFQTIELITLDDGMNGPDTSFTVTLASPTSGVLLGTPSTCTCFIRETDPPPSVQFETAVSSNSESVTSPLVLITLSAASRFDVSVYCGISGGDATAGVDYFYTPGILTFAPFTTTTAIPLIIVDDTLIEPTESIIFDLLAPSFASLGTTSASQYLILDNDPAPASPSPSPLPSPTPTPLSSPTPTPHPSPTPTPSPKWTRVYQGKTGDNTRMLYAGACDASVPAFVDIDGDGDLDLFVGQKQGMPMFLRNDGTAGVAGMTFIAQNLDFTSLSAQYSTPAFADLNGDGLPDLIMGDSLSGAILYFQNIGTAAAPAWQDTPTILASFTPGHRLRPALVDIDGDGDLDLFVGKEDGTISFYLNEGGPQIPLWTLITFLYEGISVAGAASPAFCDMDGDGAYDLFVGDGTGSIYYYRNAGSATNAAFTSGNIFLSNIGANAAPALADIDHNGVFDLFVGTEAGMVLFYKNKGSVSEPSFVLAKPLLGAIDAGSNSAPDLADIDGDGDQDLFIAAERPGVAGGSLISFYRNTGKSWLTNWSLENDDLLGGAIPGAAPRLVDIDGDGKLDLAIGDRSAGVRWFRNAGDGQTMQFLEVTTMTIPTPGTDPKPDFADVDGDGALDLFVGCQNGGARIYYIHNGGDAFAPAWDAPLDITLLLGVSGPDGVAVSAADVDGDGRPDLMLALTSGTLLYCHCLQTTPSLLFDLPMELPFGAGESNPIPVLADVNGDLRPDVMLGGANGGVRLFRNPIPNLRMKVNTVTLISGQSMTFETVSAVAGHIWEITRNQSSGTIDPVTGVYTAGPNPGVDIVRLRGANGSWGVVRINVVTLPQSQAAGKAVIMAGRKTGDTLWTTTNELSNYVYNMLLYRGFLKSNIYYLNPDVAQDVDGNGFQDDVTAPSTLDNLETAMTTWAQGSPNLFVYFVDHGGQDDGESFIRCNETEVLYASQLNEWLTHLQDTGTSLIAVGVDCCQSGGFLTRCHATTGPARIVFSSAASDEPAFFSADGLISFTNGFASASYRGQSIGAAFDEASGAISAYQTPQLDDTGDGVYDKSVDGALARAAGLGVYGVTGPDGPQIGGVSPNQRITTAGIPVTIWASDVSSPYAIERVWATITPPRLVSGSRLTPDVPILTPPQMELAWNNMRNRYEATTNTFMQLGAYLVNVYARDINGGLSYPKQTYVLQSEAKEKAIILCGPGDFDLTTPWSNCDHTARMAYQTLQARWLLDEDITYLSVSTDTLVDGAPNKINLAAAIAAAAGMDQLTIYLIGNGSTQSLDLNGNDLPDAADLKPGDLQAMITALQLASTIKVVVVLEFKHAGAWLASLTPQGANARVVIASCAGGEQAALWANGTVSFSQYFFDKILAGNSVRAAFNSARTAIRGVTSENQNPQLDDDGSGTATKRDGPLAQVTYIGSAFTPQADAPIIGRYPRYVPLTSNTALLWASDVWDGDGISAVYAKIIGAGDILAGDMVIVNLSYSTATARWEAVYDGFILKKRYMVFYFARDRKGNVSNPYAAVYAPAGLSLDDDFDQLFGDNTPATLNFMTSASLTQTHNFNKAGDADWAIFNATSNRWYTIRVSDQAARCDAIAFLYYSGNLRVPDIARDDNWAGGGDEVISWWSGATSGAVFVKIAQSPDADDLYGDATTYVLTISSDWGDNAGLSTLSPTTMGYIGSSGGTLSAGSTGLYTMSSLSVPSGALGSDVRFGLSSTGDVGTSPYYNYTTAWLSAHPNNASLFQLMLTTPVSFTASAAIAVQFVNDESAFPGFPVRDLPAGHTASEMRIFTWTGAQWQLLPGTQTVVGNTVTGAITQAGEIGHESGFNVSLFAVAPGPPAPSPTPHPTPSPTPHPTPSPTLHPSPTPSPTPHPTPSPTPSPTPTPKGTVHVSVEPTSAAWSLQDGQGGTHPGSGNQTLNTIPAGLITLTWQPLSGFDTPTTNPASQTLTNGGSVSFVGRYTLPQSLLRNYLSGRGGSLTSDQLRAADINSDGRIDISDLIALIQMGR
ncbi:MAG: FG-GAP-like repeat-containing protein [Candidatus Sumerlaeota bacterium]|nr:FG-GAP-like repeat-containing protein [Candidatus Sumerlaeota bacterium]